ncbi:MAG: hypothetical protein WD398_05680 [Cyclobacteriaceae bacterium]
MLTIQIAAMKNTTHLLLSLGLLFSLSCSSGENNKSASLAMKVANAYGYDHLDDVKSISYTWNVRRDSVNVLVRDWSWDISKGEVYYSGPDTTVTYLISEKPDDLDEVDQKFINDKYWLLFPFQLAWDTGFEQEIIENQTSPISGKTTTKMIVRYNESDGYTPGDAYDLYINDKNMIEEWVFRRGDGPEGRAFTWENIKDFDGVKITLDHFNADGEKVIWFSDVKVTR